MPRPSAAEISKLYDVTENSFFGAGEHVDKPAVNINTIDEVPDSSWFTNRVGLEAARGRPERRTIDRSSRVRIQTGPSRDLTIVSGKMEGRVAGLHRPRQRRQQIYFIKFDPAPNPEMASGARSITTKFLYAFGYHVPENYLATLRPRVAEDRRGRAHRGRRRPQAPDGAGRSRRCC